MITFIDASNESMYPRRWKFPKWPSMFNHQTIISPYNIYLYISMYIDIYTHICMYVEIFIYTYMLRYIFLGPYSN